MATATVTYPPTKERTNYARLCRAIVDLCTDVLREILSLQSVPSQLLTKLRTTEWKRPLSASEMFKINQSVQTSSYKNLDISLLYQIITTLSVQELRYDLSLSLPAKDVWAEIKKDAVLKSKLSKEQIKKLEHASSLENYSCCDCELLVLVISHINPGYSQSILPSKKAWGGNMPSLREIELGDDIERIRILRNKVYGHVCDTEVTDKDFNAIFQDFKGIMSRMDQRLHSSGQFSKATSDIETSPIDESWDKYMSELNVLVEAEKTVRDELNKTKEHVGQMSQTLADMETNLKSQSEKITQVENKFSKFESETVKKLYDIENKTERDENATSYVPQHIKEQNKLIMSKWETEDEVYVETNATKYIYDQIKQTNILTVIGNGGTGKSATIHHLALQLQLQGYEVFVIHNPEEIKAILNPNSKQLYVIDDPVGVYTLDKNILNLWLMYDVGLNQCLTKGDVKFLCSIRRQIVYDPEFLKENCILNKCIIDLQGITCFLSPSEKIAIFKRHMSVNKCNIVITKTVEYILLETDGKFPLLCKLFFAERKFQTDDFIFFKCPFVLYRKELDKLKSSDKRKYCILVLCFANGNCFIPQKFNVFEQPDAQTDSFIHACGVNKYEFIEALGDNLCTLTGSFLTKEDDVYKFCHDLIHHVVAFHFGQKYPKQMIQLSPSRFLFERVVLNAEMVKDDTHVIVLQSMFFDDLLERLLEDLEKNIYNYVIMNKCWKDDLFMQTFEQKFQSDKDHILGLFTRETSKLPVYLDDIFTDLRNSDRSETWTWHYRAMDLLRFSRITALHWLVTFANERLFDIIWKHLSSDKRKNISRDFPLLHLACLGGNVHICRTILSDELDKINAPFSETLTSAIGESYICDYLPLHLAAMNNTDVVKLLLDHGAEINLTQKIGKLAGRSALYHASGRGKTEIVSLLIERGADFFINNDSGPLWAAISNNHPDVVELLLKSFACSDKEDSQGITPLMAASSFGLVGIVKILLQYKPDIAKKTIYGTTALEFAKVENNEEVVEILQRHIENGERA